MFQRWGISPREFTAAIGEHGTDEAILSWLSERVTPDRTQAANAWLARQRAALDRHDAEEGVPGAIAPFWPPRGIMLGIGVATLVLLGSWLARHWQH